MEIKIKLDEWKLLETIVEREETKKFGAILNVIFAAMRKRGDDQLKQILSEQTIEIIDFIKEHNIIKE